MNAVRKQRLIIVSLIFFGLSAAVGLMFYALQSNINLFFTPQQVAAGEAPNGAQMRVGGLVKVGSVVRQPDSLEVRFVLTDGQGEIPVYFEGILPDLFREGQGIVANGVLVSQARFEAEEVLAKHDETYMPPEVQEALEKAGHPAAAGKEKPGGSY